MEVFHGDLAIAEALPLLDQIARRARSALRERTGLLDQIERAMRRLVRQLQHVIQTQPRIGHVLLGEIGQARVHAEALQRGLQIAGELAQIEEQHALATLQQRVELGVERRLVAGRKRVGEHGDGGAKLFAQSCSRAGRHAVSRIRRPPACPRILSIFSLSVIAVNGLIT